MASIVVVTGYSPSAKAEDGLGIDVDITYTFDPPASTVHVVMGARLTNQIADVRDGNIIRQRYFTGYRFIIPAGAQNIAATQSGSPVSVEVEPTETGRAQLISIDFRSNLFYRSTASLQVTYDLIGSAPRSDDAVRINPSYAAFDVFGFADPGQLDITVVLPEGVDVETVGSDLEETNSFGSVVLTATDIADPESFYTFVSVRDDDQLQSDPVKVDGTKFDVQSWPGDDEWSRFVRSLVKKTVPSLEEHIGLEFPLDGPIEVREAYTPYLFGYAGWFNADTQELEVGEELERDVVAHELSHAWFNADLFTERWINEGLAQTYASLVVTDLGKKGRKPKLPKEKPFPLHEWDRPVFSVHDDEIEANEDYGYAASFSVIDSLYDEVGEEGMQAIFAAADAQLVAYQGDREPELAGTSSADWRRLLDLAEELAGSTEFQDVLVSRVLTSAEKPKLKERQSSRDSYATLDEAGDEWAVPWGIRRAMSNWTFLRADQLIEDATAIIESRDALAAATEKLGVEPLASYETEYEELLEVDESDLTERMDADTAAAGEVLAAVEAEAVDDGFFGNLGLRDADLETPLAEARAAISNGDPETAEAKAAEVQKTIAGAEQAGKDYFWNLVMIIGGIVLGLILLLVILLVLRRRRRRRRAAAAMGAVDDPVEVEGRPEDD